MRDRETTGAGRPLRVIQWSVGNIGRQSLRAVIQHPGMTLVGLFVHSADKAGQDAGELCGLDPTGVRATNSVDEIVALDADCVLYMRQGCDIDEVAALLRSGKNVVTTRGEFHHPAAIAPAVRDRIEQACRDGRTSLYSTGSSPGFATEALVFPLLSLERRLDCVTVDEFADLATRNSPMMLFDLMGFGKAPGPMDDGTLHHVRESFVGSLGQVAEAIGRPFDDTRVEGETAAVRRDTTIAAGTVKAGTVGAQRITVTGLHAGKPVLRFRAHWYCTTDVDAADWNLRETGWRVQVEGDTPLDVSITFPVAAEDYPAVMPGLTAHRAVNAVEAVCAAPPGIRTTADLPQVIAAL